VVLQTGGPVEMPWLGKVAAVLEAWYPGQEAGNAIADVLTGAAEPGGRLPQSFPVKWADNPTTRRIARSIPGSTARCATRKACSSATGTMTRHGIAPLFPFGFGLGYTSFAVSDLELRCQPVRSGWQGQRLGHRREYRPTRRFRSGAGLCVGARCGGASGRPRS
jgi:beta-glucosidase